MNKYKCSLVALFIFFTLPGLPAQTHPDSLVARVLRNNKSLRSATAELEAQNAGFRTGIYLPDPVFNLDYMAGSPAVAGNQTDFSVNQSFDFPTAYGWRKKIADLEISHAGQNYYLLARETALEVRQLMVEIIFLNQRKNISETRQTDARNFLNNYEKKFEAGDATILEVNKARLRLANQETDLRLIETRRAECLNQLAQLNGGSPVILNDTAWPDTLSLSELKASFAYAAGMDPEGQQLEAAAEIAQARKGLHKSLWLPRFEVGYHYQGILGQTYQGAHIGFSIPLWQNKNMVRTSQLENAWAQAKLQERSTQLQMQLQQWMDVYQKQLQALAEYKRMTQTLSDASLLNKALEAGQLNVLDYYLELTLYYETVDRQLQIEKDCMDAYMKMRNMVQNWGR